RDLVLPIAQRHPNVYQFTRRQTRKLKARGHHADHGVTLVVERYRLIDDTAISRKPSLLERITQHGHALLTAREHSAERGLCLQHRKQVRRNVSTTNALRLRAARDVEAVICISGNRVEDL